MPSCCVYKKPYDAEYPWTCPVCKTVNTKPDRESIQRGFAVIRAMHEREPTETELLVVRVLEAAARLIAVGDNFSLIHGLENDKYGAIEALADLRKAVDEMSKE